MRILFILLSLVAGSLVFGQRTTSQATSYDFCRVSRNMLLLYEKQQDGFIETTCSMQNDSLHGHFSEKVRSISDDSDLSEVNVHELDPNFDIIRDFKNKVYFTENKYRKIFYYLKGNDTLVYRSFHRKNAWTLEEEKKDKIYKINLGNNKSVYWSTFLGLIYKKNNKIGSRLLDLTYLYKDSGIEFNVKSIDDAHMEINYFDVGKFTVKIDENNNYTIFKGEEKIIDKLNLKYYNDSVFIAINEKTIDFYNPNFRIDSSFVYRDINEERTFIEFLVGNKIKKFFTSDYTRTQDHEAIMGCGCCSSPVYLKIEGKKIRQVIDIYEGDKFTGIEIYMNNKFQFDSVFFMNRNTIIEAYSENAINKLMIFKRGNKEGLYSFTQENGNIKITDIVPIKFDKIRSIDNFIILTKENRTELLSYYLKNKNMRFKSLQYKDYSYIRYTQGKNKAGWLNKHGTLFEDQ